MLRNRKRTVYNRFPAFSTWFSISSTISGTSFDIQSLATASLPRTSIRHIMKLRSANRLSPQPAAQLRVTRTPTAINPHVQSGAQMSGARSISSIAESEDLTPASRLLTRAEVNSLRHKWSNQLSKTSSRTNTGSFDKDVTAIVHHLFAVQAQDVDAMLLSIWTRMRPRLPTRIELLQTIQQEHESLVRFWGNRVTLHLATLENRRAICKVCCEHVHRRRLSAVVSGRADGARLMELYEQVEQRVKQCLKDRGNVDSDIVRQAVLSSFRESDMLPEDIADEDLLRRMRYSVSVLLTVGMFAKREISVTRGVTLLAEGNGIELGTEAHEEDALLVCAKHFFHAYAPAKAEDFCYWMGCVPAKQCRDAVKALLETSLLHEMETELGPMLIPSNRRVPHVVKYTGPRVVIRGRFDPLLLAHKDKCWIVRQEYRQFVWSNNADISAVVIFDGFVVGVWRKARNKLLVRLFDVSGNVVDLVRGAFEEFVFSFYGDHLAVEISVELVCGGVDAGASDTSLRGRKRKRT